jgi:glycyl-tRNA synthetase
MNTKIDPDFVGIEDKMQKIVSLCKRRGFVFPSSEIYGGLANSWDFGPLGAQLKKNIKDLWWQYFVVERDDIVGIDGALMMNPRVWEASGHLQGFVDPLVECKKCKKRFRADHLVAVNVSGSGPMRIVPPCMECHGQLSKPRQFNLMFKTFIGPVEDKTSTVYLRPETAQGMFVNFKNVQSTMRMKIPFGIAQIGKAFRNEITPGNFIFRVLEFEQMEIEYFIRVQDCDLVKQVDQVVSWHQHFDRWQQEMSKWLEYIGINPSNYSIREHSKDELSHYSKRTIDFEYKFPFGVKELYGLAYRTDFDLKNHQKYSGQDLKYTDPQTGERFVPHVIEPTFGVERTVLAVLCDAYKEENIEDEKRVVLKLDKKLAPIKVAIFPLLRNKPKLVKKAREIYNDLKSQYMCEFDDSGNIGKRYRRQDEIGTPYCVTIDFDTLEDDTVTLRDRDTMEQERVAVQELSEYLKEKFK